MNKSASKTRWVFNTASHVLPFLYASVAILVLWQMVVVITNPTPSALPSVPATAVTFLNLATDGQLFLDIVYSLRRLLIAWGLSIIIAVPLGVLMGTSKLWERFINPFVELIRPISPLAWIPMAILWFGIDETSKIFVVFLGTFFPILLNTVDGVKGVDPVLINAGRVFGCTSRTSLFWRVVIPAAVPSVIVGLRLGFGTGWAYIIAAELVASDVGLGFLIAQGMYTLRADMVLVGMIVIGLLGFLFDILFQYIQRRVSRE